MLTVKEWLMTLEQESPNPRSDKNRSLFINLKRKKTIRKLHKICNGSRWLGAKENLRLLASFGLIQWSENINQSYAFNFTDLSEISLAVFAFWPIIRAKNLPKNWYDDLKEFSSPLVAKAVLKAKLEVDVHGELSALRKFYSEIDKPIYSVGVKNVLDDLSDFKRGGKSFATISYLAFCKKPPKNSSIKDLFFWIGSVAVAGIIGNASWDIIKMEWEKYASNTGMWSSSDTQDFGGDGGSTESKNESSTGTSGHSNTQASKNQTQNSSFWDIIADWFENIFDFD